MTSISPSRRFDLDEFTEELLEEHEKELEEINLYYLHNEQLFVNLASWHETWAEYRDFQVSPMTRRVRSITLDASL